MRKKEIEPIIIEATTKVLLLSMGLGIDNYQAMEVFSRALVSIALDASNGDNEIAAQWIDEWLLPNITGIRDDLAKGGKTEPAIVDGKFVH